MRIIVTAAGGSGGRFLTEALQAARHYVIGTDADATQLELAISNERRLVPVANAPSYGRVMAILAEEVAADLAGERDTGARWHRAASRGNRSVHEPTMLRTYVMLRGQDVAPVYLTRQEWEALCTSRPVG